MEFFLENRIYLFLALIIFILLYKIWKDLEFKGILDKKIEDLSANSLNNSKELSPCLSKLEKLQKNEFVLEYLKRLDQNASRLADNIQGEQSMTRAIEMARQGKDHLDIIKETGLSNEEVEAIIHSHKE